MTRKRVPLVRSLPWHDHTRTSPSLWCDRFRVMTRKRVPPSAAVVRTSRRRPVKTDRARERPFASRSRGKTDVENASVRVPRSSLDGTSHSSTRARVLGRARERDEAKEATIELEGEYECGDVARSTSRDRRRATRGGRRRGCARARTTVRKRRRHSRARARDGEWTNDSEGE